MPNLTADQKKILNNHLPTIKHYAEVFLTCLDLKMEKEVEKAYLVALLTKMEGDLAEAKKIIEE